MTNFLKIRTLFFLISILPIFLLAQNSINPWELKLGINIINIQQDNISNDLNIGVPSVSISRYIAGGFSIGGQYSMNKITGASLPSDLSYYSLDGFLKYSISGKSKLSPYFFAGYGFSSFENEVEKKGIFPSSDVSETSFAGIGFNIDLSEKIGINVNSAYRNADESKAFKHFQHVLGLSIKLGSLDSDGDGISDKNDKCPEVPGLEEFLGCPDTDGDGIIDKEDQCPDQAGSPEMNGCADSDGDGIADNVDECPDKVGSADMNGCPDSDGDGVSDEEDACPDEAGENDGCPWPDEDGDGVPDKDDQCYKTKGPISNRGCPEVPQEIMEVLNTFGSSINFAASSDRVIGSKTINVINQIKKLLEEYPNSTLLIEGHTSSDGEEDFNFILSEKRANSVMDYLIDLGVDKNRLEAVGKGELDPLHDNDNPWGRARNRRVEFKTKFN